MIKMAFALGSALGLLLYIDRKRVKATFGEYTTKDCKCFEVEYFADGTVKSTEVDRERCMADEGLRAELGACGGKTIGLGDALQGITLGSLHIGG